MSCVYIIDLPYTESMYPGQIVIKIGYSCEVTRRLRELSTAFERSKTPKFRFGLNGPEYNSNKGLRILERLFHFYLQKYRLDKTCELFNMTEFPTGIIYVCDLLIKGGNDIQPYYSIEDLPPIGQEIIIKYDPPEGVYQPFDYQKPIVDKICEHYLTRSIGYIFCPPGYGKTYLAGFAIQKWVEGIYLIVTPQIMICMEFAKMFDNLGINYTHVTSSSELDQTSQVLIMTYSMFKLVKDQLPKITFAIFDEAHHIQEQNSWSEVQTLSCKKLLLTATPKICSNKQISEEEEYEVNLRFDKDDIIFRSEIDSDIEAGILCPIKLFIYDGYEEMIHELLYTYNRKYVVMFFNTCESARTAMSNFQKYLDKNPIYDFTVDLTYIDGQTPQSIRPTILNRSPTTNMKIVFNVNIIGEGVSVREIDAVCFMEPRKSSIGLMQNIGRAMRVYPEKINSMIIVPSSQESDIEAIMKSLYHSGCRKLSINTIGQRLEIANIQEKYINLWTTYCNLRKMKSFDDWLDLCIEYEQKFGLITRDTKYNNENIGQWLYRQKSDLTTSKLYNLQSWYNLIVLRYEKLNIPTIYLKYREYVGLYNSETKKIYEYDLINFCPYIDLLEYYDECWKPINDFKLKIRSFDDWIKLCKIAEEKSTINTATKLDNILVGEWFYRQISKQLTEYETQQLTQLKTWKNLSNFSHWYSICKEYETKVGIINTKTIYNNNKIGSWLNAMRHATAMLDASEIDKLKGLNSWNCQILSHEEKVKLCIEYEQTDELKQSTIYQDVKLGIFLDQQIQNYRKGKLSEEQIKLMKQVRRFNELSNKEVVQSRAKDLSYEQKVDMCVEYELTGEIVRSTIYKDIKLGPFLNWQIQEYRKGKLSEDKTNLMKQVRRFNELSNKEVVQSRAKDLSYEQKVDMCVEYELTGEIVRSTIYQDVKLGGFLDQQIQNYKKGKLSKEKTNLMKQVRRFNELSNKEVKSKAKDLSYEQKVKMCIEYERTGELKHSTIYQDVKLGTFLDQQIQAYRKGKMSEEKTNLMKQVRRFNELSNKEVKSKAKDLSYEQKVNMCIEYERTGELKYSTIYQDVKLGTFLDKQIQAYRKGKMSEERLKLMSNVQKFIELTS
jgi:superfamily II DNA or RNA helicase